MPDLFWNGEPIFYRRATGFGLVIGGLHYRFDANGRLTALDGLTQPVLDMLLKQQHGDAAGMVSTAYAETPLRRMTRMRREMETKKTR